MKVLAYGEILWDVIEGSEHLGGAPFNFAAHGAQCGNQSYMVSRLGKDSLGQRAFNQMTTHNVNSAYVQWDDKYPTGIVDVTLLNGQPDYIIRENAAYDFIGYDSSLQKINNQFFDVFYFGSLIQRSDVSRKTLYSILQNNKFKHIFYDVNLRKRCFTPDIIKESLAVCNILKLNVDEVPVLSNMLAKATLTNEEFCRRIIKDWKNIKTIIVTAGEKGCYVFTEQFVFVPGSPAKVVDAVGAGDAFSAAFMHVLSRTEDPVMAGKIANRVGAFVATKKGAIPAYSDEIKIWLRDGVQSLL